MKVKAYIRVGKHPDGSKRAYKIEANTAKPSYRPLTDINGGYLPTVAFAIEFNIPDAMFTQAEQIIATLTIPESQVQVTAQVAMADKGRT